MLKRLALAWKVDPFTTMKLQKPIEVRFQSRFVPCFLYLLLKMIWKARVRKMCYQVDVGGKSLKSL